jgi:hypothetical protein
MNYFADGTQVTIHSLGIDTPGEFHAIVRGIAVKDNVEPAQIYILEMVDVIDADYEYRFATFPRACLREGWN